MKNIYNLNMDLYKIIKNIYSLQYNIMMMEFLCKIVGDSGTKNINHNIRMRRL